MKRGVVAMLDALGFKGIWKRFDADAIVARLESARETEERFDLHGFDVQFAFLSDTVVIACDFGERPPIEALYFVSFRVGYFLESMLTCEPPQLAYRGAIAAGDYLIKGNTIIGEAVDEAAIGEKKAEGPVVWLTESATQLLPDNFAPTADDAAQGPFFLMPFDVTLKSLVVGGPPDVCRTFVVPPTVAVRECEKIGSRLLSLVTDEFPDKRVEAKRLLEAIRTHYIGWPLPLPARRSRRS